MARVTRLSIRIASAVALVLVSTYYLLASIPFSYYHFLQFPHFWWLPLFISAHPLVLASAVAALLLTVGRVPERLKPWVRYAALATVSTVVCMIAVAWQPQWLSYELAATLSFVPLALLTMIGGIELVSHAPRFAERAVPPTDAGVFIGTAAIAGTLSAAVYVLDASVHGATEALQSGELAVAAGASAVGHTILFALIALAVVSVRSMAARRGWARYAELAAIGALAAIVLAVLLRRAVLSALVLGDARAIALSAALAIALTTFLAALIASRGPATKRPRWSRAGAAALIAIVTVGALPRLLLLADWGGTLQKLVVFATWAAVVGLVAALPAGRWRRSALAAALIALIVAVVPGAVAARRDAPRPSNDRDPLNVPLVIDRYATFDTSLMVLLDVLRPLVADHDFYVALQRAGDATDDRSLPAVPLRAVAEPRARSGHWPNIFIIVVDSLRPDYVSAYNPAVSFTPAIGAFAGESIVMRHAFTAYAGTALSEPSLWAGGLIPRAMYVKPFSRVNNLEQLVRFGNYRRYISVDGILTTILEDRPGLVRLDAELAHPEDKDQAFKFDLCTTLGELTGRLDRDRGAGPVFFYSQPQNLHIRVLVGDEQYPRFEALRIGTADFYKPAVTVLQRLDACFGGFIDRLKASGVYDDSIIVLTSDHGDAYGDGGRWGHAFYLAPETMRIPLIIHVPAPLRAGRTANADAAAMLTDVTPTLYDLLGLPPTNDSGLLGRSLMPRIGAPLPPRDDLFLVQSSYSRVFGLIDSQGRWMYTADVNHAQEQLFDLVEGGPYPKALGAAARLQYRKWLLDRLGAVGRYYRPTPPT